jgi:hypothetical protein
MVGGLFRTTCVPLRPAGILLSCLLLGPIFAVQAQEAPTKPNNFDSRPWIGDFHQLLHELGTHYSNLEWALNDRKMNVPDLRKKTEDALQNAHSDSDTRTAIKTSLDSFGDGQLEIEWSGAEGRAPKTKPEADVCEQLGYHPRAKPGIDNSAGPQFLA